ncbi:hypothetical protein LPB67_11055 [Undibacterium sp. Jales W-56]|nr:hypothetical protein [Undibacterium sp. Jales W-56]MCU6434309.1 hypothetical protein [Undibacterium sp. Jales W-56]
MSDSKTKAISGRRTIDGNGGQPDFAFLTIPIRFAVIWSSASAICTM